MSAGVPVGSRTARCSTHPRSRTAARRGLSLTTLALLVSLLAGAPRAEEVHTQLTGKVYLVSPDTPEIGAALASLGVAVDAQAVISYSVDSEAVAGKPVNDFTVYPDAVLSCSVVIGDYVAQLSSEILAPYDAVQVGDNINVDFSADSYGVVAASMDTDAILHGPLVTDALIIELIMTDGDGSTLSDEGVVQDVSGFQLGLGYVSGTNGIIGIMIDLDSGGPGPGPGDPASALARKGQMLAAKNFGKSVLKASAKFAAAPPEKDPFGDKEDALVDQAQDKFLLQFSKAVSKALKKGGTAPLPDEMKEEAAASVLDGCGELVESLLTGALPDDKHDRALRGKLIRAAAAQLAAELVAQAKDVAKPDPAKLAAKLAKAHDKLEGAVNKALAKAAKQDVAYAGPDAEAIAAAVSSLVDAYVELTAGAD